jgi:hypothetical protein
MQDDRLDGGWVPDTVAVFAGVRMSQVTVYAGMWDSAEVSAVKKGARADSKR